MTLIRVPYKGGPFQGLDYETVEDCPEMWTDCVRMRGKRAWLSLLDSTFAVYRLKKTKTGWVNVYQGTVEKLGQIPAPPVR